ncbi:MAG: RrF2 family transcriptional regulator [Candidatus Omnitrophota bacterium]
MMRLSTKGRYAARFMLELALHYANGNMLLKDIARRQGISEGYLEHIVPPLRAAGLVNSVRGAGGGYALARPPAEIDLKEIVLLMEGSLSPAECIDNSGACKRSPYCVTQDVWRELGEKISETLESITLKDLAQKHIEKEEKHLIYHI